MVDRIPGSQAVVTRLNSTNPASYRSWRLANSSGRASGNRDSSSGAHAPCFFEGLGKVSRLEDGQLRQFFNKFGEISHFNSSLQNIFQNELRQFWLPEISHVFHGRDIFAPAAAHLANGVALSELGSPVSDPALARPGYRNFYLPHRRDPFAGFRTARDSQAGRRARLAEPRGCFGQA